MLAAALALAAGTQVLPPVERCGGDPAFAHLRNQLEKAVAAHDLQGLAGLMSDDVRISFGGGLGKEAFTQQWAGSASDRDLLWKELAKAVHLGCAEAVDGSGKKYRAMPAMFVTGDDFDGFSTWVALPGAIVRSRPKAGTPVRRRLGAWTVLEEVEHDGGDWIELPARGYVSTTQARSLIDYRIVFGRRDGEWRITAFVAGD